MQSSFALGAVIILPLKLTAQTEDVLNPTPDKLPKNCKERRATEKKQGPSRGQGIGKGFGRLAR